MNAALDRIRQELIALGFEPYVVQGTPVEVLAFPFKPQKGRYQGGDFHVGLSFQEADYPESPPHWVHVTPPIVEQHGNPGMEYRDSAGRRWVAFSRPPADFWDQLPEKNMANYVFLHLRRFWREA